MSVPVETKTPSRSTAFVAVMKNGLPQWATLSSNPGRTASSALTFQGTERETFVIHAVHLFRVYPDADGAVKPPPRHHFWAYSLLKKSNNKVLKKTYLTTSLSSLQARYARNQAKENQPMSFALAQQLGLVEIAYFHCKVTKERISVVKPSFF